MQVVHLDRLKEYVCRPLEEWKVVLPRSVPSPRRRNDDLQAQSELDAPSVSTPEPDPDAITDHGVDASPDDGADSEKLNRHKPQEGTEASDSSRVVSTEIQTNRVPVRRNPTRHRRLPPRFR